MIRRTLSSARSIEPSELRLSSTYGGMLEGWPCKPVNDMTTKGLLLTAERTFPLHTGAPRPARTRVPGPVPLLAHRHLVPADSGGAGRVRWEGWVAGCCGGAGAGLRALASATHLSRLDCTSFIDLPEKACWLNINGGHFESVNSGAKSAPASGDIGGQRMGKKRVGEIVISRRVVQIGHEIYPLANISRVQTLQVYWSGKLATLYPLRRMIIVVIAAGAVVAAARLVPSRLPVDVDPDIEHIARQFATLVAVLAGVRVAFLLVILIYRLLFRRRHYALVIETSGTQYTALSGRDFGEIQRIKNIIVDAIENPPLQATRVEVRGDLVMGDKADRNMYKQDGSGNRMFT